MKGYSIKVMDRHDDMYIFTYIRKHYLDFQVLLLNVGLAIWMIFGRLS
jgi:hypothetical protein